VKGAGLRTVQGHEGQSDLNGKLRPTPQDDEKCVTAVRREELPAARAHGGILLHQQTDQGYERDSNFVVNPDLVSFLLIYAQFTLFLGPRSHQAARSSWVAVDVLTCMVAKRKMLHSFAKMKEQGCGR
jgi:hypothetical protein